MRVPFYKTLFSNWSFKTKLFSIILVLFLKVKFLVSGNLSGVYYLRSGRMFLYPCLGGLFKDISVFGGREFLVFKSIENFLVSNIGCSVLDVGANVGYYSLLFNRYAGDVFMVEPYSFNCKVLRRNLELNYMDCENVFCCALGSVNGVGRLNISFRHNLCSLNRVESCYVGFEDVFVFRGDDLFAGLKFDLVRMDVEGFEVEVMKGLDDCLSDDCVVFMELHVDILGDEKLLEFLRFMYERFECCGVIYESKFPYSGFVGAIVRLINDFPIVIDEVFEDYIWLFEVLSCNCGAPQVIFRAKKECF